MDFVFSTSLFIPILSPFIFLYIIYIGQKQKYFSLFRQKNSSAYFKRLKKSLLSFDYKMLIIR